MWGMPWRKGMDLSRFLRPLWRLMIGPATARPAWQWRGPIINRHSGLRKRLKSIPLRHGIPHIDLVRTYLGLLCQGKNDFEAVEEVRKDLFFQQALEIGRVPSSARLRQRFGLFIETLAQTRREGTRPISSACWKKRSLRTSSTASKSFLPWHNRPR